MRRFYHEKIEVNSDSIIISGKEAVHIKKVLRLKQGEQVIITDGNGNDYTTILDSFLNRDIVFKVLSIEKGKKDSKLNLSVAFSMIKGKKIDEVIRPLTETGVSALLPFVSSRSISDPDLKKINNKIERWKQLSIEAIKQCERSTLPDIKYFPSFNELMDQSIGYDLKILFYERSDIPLKDLKGRYNNPEKVLIVIGPEGGFTDDELKKAKEFGFETPSLGPRILRADTAIVCSAFLCQHLFGDII